MERIIANLVIKIRFYCLGISLVAVVQRKDVSIKVIMSGRKMVMSRAGAMDAHCCFIPDGQPLKRVKFKFKQDI